MSIYTPELRDLVAAPSDPAKAVLAASLPPSWDNKSIAMMIAACARSCFVEAMCMAVTPKSGASAMMAVEVPMMMRMFAAAAGISPDPVVMPQIRAPRRHAMAVTASSVLLLSAELASMVCTESCALL